MFLLNVDGLVAEARQCRDFAVRLHQAALGELFATRPGHEIEYRYWGSLTELAQALASVSDRIGQGLRHQP